MVRGELPPERVEQSGRACAAALAAALIGAGAPTLALGAETPGQFTAGPVVVIEADAVDETEEELIVATGRVVATYQGRTLRAERVIYDRTNRTLRAQGGVQVVQADGSVLTADELEFDDDLSGGVAVRFATRLADGSTLAAATAVREPDGTTDLSRAVFTSCPVCADGDQPTWSLRANRAVQNPENQLIEYRGLSLNFGSVPVAYFPVFAHADPTAGRRSGFLIPTFSRNRRLGVQYAQPYYVAISPYQDLTLTPNFYGNVNPLLEAEYRRRFYSGLLRLNGGVTYEQDFDDDGEGFGEEALRSHIFGEGGFQISPYWRWGFGIERASDDLYLARYRIPYPDPRVGKYKGDISRLLTQANITGQDASSYVSASAITIQGLRVFDESATLPVVAPYAEAERVFRDPFFDGALRLTTSTYNLLRSDERRDSTRLSAAATYRVERVFGPGLVASPFAMARTDYYRTTENSAETSVSRNLGLIGAELRWPLIRPGRITAVVEPIVVAGVASGEATEADIPNEDTLSFEVDETSVFRMNATPNYDLWEPGGRIAAGVRATALFDGGSARAEIGRRWRSEADPTFDESTNLAGTQSDYVGVVALDLGPSLGAQVRFRLDDETLEFTRTDATARAAVGRLSASARYFNVDERLRPGEPNEELTAGLGLRLTRHWTASAGLRRDLASDLNISNTAALTYRDACTFLELVYERRETQNRTLGPEEGFTIRIGLSTLGAYQAD